jgi:hypothetical protein
VKIRSVVLTLILSLSIVLAGCSPGDISESVYFQDIYPNTDDTYDLGSSSYSWQDIYADGTVYADLSGYVNGYEVARTATYVVAASNASAQSIAQADYVCDGINDEETIQSAFDALPSDGGHIVLSEGTFYVRADTGLQLKMYSNTSLSGQPDATILEAVSGGNCIVSVNGDVTIAENITIRDLILDSSGTADCDGIGISGTYLVTLRNILVENIHSLASFPKSTVDCGHPTMTALDEYYNICIRNITHDGGDQQPGITISAPDKAFTRIGGFWIENCYINAPYNDGILVEGGMDGVYIYNNIILMPGRYGITLMEYGSSYPRNVWIGNNLISGMSATGSSGIYTYGCQNTHILNNSIISGKWGIRFGSGSTAYDNIWVIGNTVKTNGSNVGAIYGEKQVTNLVISSNYLETYNYYPIRLVAAVAGSVFVYGNIGVETSKVGDSFCRCDNTYVGIVRNNVYNQVSFTTGTGLQQLDNVVLDGTTYKKTAESGTATIASGSTSVVVNHGLATTPTRVLVTPRENPTNAVSFWWVDTLTTTQFTIHVNTDPGASNLDFDWRAVIGEGN